MPRREQVMKPRHYLQWHILHPCNLHCRHCYQDDRDAVMPREEMVSLLDKYTRYLESHDFEGQVNLTGGEPLLHPEFFPLAREVKSRRIRLGILTNGTLITDEIAGELSCLQPAFVQVSLDGPRDIHDRIRGEGSFEQALRGIDHLKRYRVRVLVSFTAMKDNYGSLGELAGVCRKHRVDKLWWDRVVTEDPSLYLSTEEFRSLSETAAKLARRYRFVSCSRALQWIPGGDCSYACSAGRRLLVALPNGDLMACRRLPFVIGNIRDGEDLASIVDGNQTMQMLARPVTTDKCLRCRHYFSCLGGARCVTYAQTGRIDSADVNCYL